VAFSDFRTIRKTQTHQDTAIAALHDERAVTQQQLAAWEGQQTGR
jgi:hypothetical protein